MNTIIKMNISRFFKYFWQKTNINGQNKPDLSSQARVILNAWSKYAHGSFHLYRLGS